MRRAATIILGAYAAWFLADLARLWLDYARDRPTGEVAVSDAEVSLWMRERSASASVVCERERYEAITATITWDDASGRHSAAGTAGSVLAALTLAVESRAGRSG